MCVVIYVLDIQAQQVVNTLFKRYNKNKIALNNFHAGPNQNTSLEMKQLSKHHNNASKPMQKVPLCRIKLV